MKPRTRSHGRVIILAEPIYHRVRATSLALGTTPAEIVSAGCRVFCTYVLHELALTAETRERLTKGDPKWQVNEIIKVLASRFASRRTS